MAIDPKEFFEVVWGIIQDEAETVLSQVWDTGSPGMSGSTQTIRWRGLYLFTSTDFEDEGPFDSLEDALCDPFRNPAPSPELRSGCLAPRKLKAIAIKVVDDGEMVVISGDAYWRSGDQLVRAEDREADI